MSSIICLPNQTCHERARSPRTEAIAVCRIRLDRLLLSTLLLLLLVANPSLQSSSATTQQTIYKPKIPLDITKWDYGTEGELEEANQRRFWDRSALQRAYSVVSYEQMRPFLDKLNSGKPVTILAFGDSIVATHAGCFHRDIQHLKQHQKVLSDSYMRGHCISTFKYRWASSFLNIINATWPHPDHILINNGIPGTTWGDFAIGICLEYMLPARADLILLEHLPYLAADSTAEDTERLLHRLQTHFNTTLPPVVFFNMHRALHNSMPFLAQAEPCIRDIAQCSAPNSSCPAIFAQLPQPPYLNTEPERDTHAVAGYYSMTSVSFGTLVHSFLRDGWHRQLNMSECQFFATIFKDPVHPGHTGRLLMADLLTNYLSMAEAYFKSQSEDPTFQPSLHAGILQPRRPMHRNSMLIPRMHCYGNMYSEVGSSDPKTQMEAAKGAPPLKVVARDGWEYIELDGAQKAFKPGWIATEPGAMIRIEVDTDFGDVPELPEREEREDDLDPDFGSVIVALHYLKSYEHMGQINVTCVSGCDCEPVVVDGHEAVFKHSIPVRLSLAVTPSKHCVIQMMVLQQTSSKEHKAKLLHVVASTLRDASADVLAIVDAQERQRSSASLSRAERQQRLRALVDG